MKKVLLITYYWPPAGGPGVQRWLKFVTYLPDNGIEPIVYCPENPTYPIVDETLESKVPTNVTILRQPIFEPYGWASFLSKKQTKTISSGIIAPKKKQSWLQRMLLFIRGNLFIPDARKFWIQPSVEYLETYLSAHPDIDAVITTGPPHSLHLIGMEVKKRTNIPWIADFRDPWTTIGYHKQLKLTKASQQLHRYMESEVLRRADHVIVTSYTTQAEFQTKTRQPVTVITNGYDPNDLPKTKTSLDPKFSLVHIGSLLSGRNPKVLWDILAELCRTNSDFAKDFKLRLVGVVSEDVIESIRSSQLEPYLEQIDYVSHSEALQYQQSARVLVLIEINSKDTRSIIPGKLFEYVAAKRPIIAIGPEQSDVERILKESNGGHYFTYADTHRLRLEILGQYEKFKSGIRQEIINNSEAYTRQNLTRQLAKVLNKVVSDRN